MDSNIREEEYGQNIMNILFFPLLLWRMKAALLLFWESKQYWILHTQERMSV